MKQFTIIFFFIVQFIAFKVYAQSNYVKAIDSYLAEAQKEWNVPGMAVAIVKDSEIILSKGYGVVSEKNEEKVNEHTLFAIASNTKAFVSSSLAVLVSRG